jgi:two-component system, NtrC family, sensor kinase
VLRSRQLGSLRRLPLGLNERTDKPWQEAAPLRHADCIAQCPLSRDFAEIFAPFPALRRYYPSAAPKGTGMGRDTKTVGKQDKKRRPTGATAKPRRAPKPKHVNGPLVVNRESRVATLTRELREVQERQAATAGILQIIASSPSDVQPVFEAVADRAMTLLDCWSVTVTRFDGEYVQFGAARGALPDTEQLVRQRYQSMRPDRASLLGRCLLERAVANSADALAEPDPQLRDYARKRGFRAVLIVPLLRGDKVEGALVLTRAEPGLFAPREIELVQTFADQAVIAIQNAGLFNEAQARTRELSASLDELRTAQDRLVQTEKLASLGQLTAGIAHEIKNPLNFVNNFSALSAELVGEMNDVLAGATLDKKTRGELDELAQMLKSNLEKVVQHGKRADSIVKNMLQHSREGSGEHRPADINAIVDESLNLAYHGARAEKAGFSIALQRDLDPSVGMADVYPQEITRVLLNLISNGFYAATKRKAEVGDGFEPLISATTKNLGDQVEIRIRDNGAGIPDEIKDKIFNPFFTTKPSGEGTGLGLSMSYDIIVKQHGGSIDVETEPGLFTEFKIVLPRKSQR